MDKTEFMEQLKTHLKRLPHEEYNEAVEYYEEYLEEGGDEVIEGLGTPKQVAAKILADYASNPKERKVNVWIVLLSLCGIPILLPIGIALIAVAFALFVTVFALIAAGAAVIISGIVSGVTSFVFILQDPLSTVFFIGYGMFSVALGYFAVVGLWGLFKRMKVGFSKLGGKVLRRFAK